MPMMISFSWLPLALLLYHCRRAWTSEATPGRSLGKQSPQATKSLKATAGPISRGAVRLFSPPSVQHPMSTLSVPSRRRSFTSRAADKRTQPLASAVQMRRPPVERTGEGGPNIDEDTAALPASLIDEMSAGLREKALSWLQHREEASTDVLSLERRVERLLDENPLPTLLKASQLINEGLPLDSAKRMSCGQCTKTYDDWYEVLYGRHPSDVPATEDEQAPVGADHKETQSSVQEGERDDAEDVERAVDALLESGDVSDTVPSFFFCMSCLLDGTEVRNATDKREPAATAGAFTQNATASADNKNGTATKEEAAGTTHSDNDIEGEGDVVIEVLTMPGVPEKGPVSMMRINGTEQQLGKDDTNKEEKEVDSKAERADAMAVMASLDRILARRCPCGDDDDDKKQGGKPKGQKHAAAFIQTTIKVRRHAMRKHHRQHKKRPTHRSKPAPSPMPSLLRMEERHEDTADSQLQLFCDLYCQTIKRRKQQQQQPPPPPSFLELDSHRTAVNLSLTRPTPYLVPTYPRPYIATASLQMVPLGGQPVSAFHQQGIDASPYLLSPLRKPKPVEIKKEDVERTKPSDVKEEAEEADPLKNDEGNSKKLAEVHVMAEKALNEADTAVTKMKKDIGQLSADKQREIHTNFKLVFDVKQIALLERQRRKKILAAEAHLQRLVDLVDVLKQAYLRASKKFCRDRPRVLSEEGALPVKRPTATCVKNPKVPGIIAIKGENLHRVDKVQSMLEKNQSITFGQKKYPRLDNNHAIFDDIEVRQTGEYILCLLQYRKKENLP
ncbi:unnamed protein product [Vitrella brassicaformis CCMP3155]|uniref:Uncharacterized protein n=2 Tax=Vitrella brassicaformis TaxID=1169539 RepID=A0A0G4FSM4_VITBC|nr:unnamed protein product [Vitrella brassicaformis CCMP3155]|eukprot:CEM17706.1 unnamed protein product [Vitrella brassicaformis CCMP3155]